MQATPGGGDSSAQDIDRPDPAPWQALPLAPTPAAYPPPPSYYRAPQDSAQTDAANGAPGQPWRCAWCGAVSPAGVPYAPLQRILLTDGVGRTLFEEYARHRQEEDADEETGWVLLGLRESAEAVALATLPAGTQTRHVPVVPPPAN